MRRFVEGQHDLEWTHPRQVSSSYLRPVRPCTLPAHYKWLSLHRDCASSTARVQPLRQPHFRQSGAHAESTPRPSRPAHLARGECVSLQQRRQRCAMRYNTAPHFSMSFGETRGRRCLRAPLTHVQSPIFSTLAVYHLLSWVLIIFQMRPGT